MFKLLRKMAILTALVLVAAPIVIYYRNPVYKRNLAQKTEQLREQLNETQKKPVWNGTVVVVDALEGDRLVVNLEGSPGVTVRLAAIDAPEMPDKFKKNGQPLAEESRNLLARLVKDKAAEMDIVGTDDTKCPLVLLTVGGVLVNAEIVRAGLAETGAEGMDSLPAKLRHDLENAQYVARQGQTNIWGLEDYVRPVEHRIRFQNTAGLTTRR
jgi:endonuclease YncB( thermonuclease family)